MRGDFIKEYVEQDLISWDLLQEHLALHDDSLKDLCMSFAQSAVMNAENFIHRVITPSVVTCYYDISSQIYAGTILYLPFQTLEQDPEFTIKIDGTDYTGTKRFIRTNTGKLIFDTPLSGSEVEISYTPTEYAQKNALIPAVLLMTGHYFTNRENNTSGHNPYINSALALLKNHRIKTQF